MNKTELNNAEQELLNALNESLQIGIFIGVAGSFAIAGITGFIWWLI